MGDLHVFLSRLQHFLSRAVAAHFGGWRIDAQELARQLEGLAVGEGNFQHPRLLVQLDFGWLWRVSVHAAVRWRVRTAPRSTSVTAEYSRRRRRRRCRNCLLYTSDAADE